MRAILTLLFVAQDAEALKIVSRSDAANWLLDLSVIVCSYNAVKVTPSFELYTVFLSCVFTDTTLDAASSSFRDHYKNRSNQRSDSNNKTITKKP